jgi:hypothetical protein
MDDARKDKEFEAGFYEDFDRLGEEAVSRHLSSGSFSVGKAEMARIWLDRKLRGAAKSLTRIALATRYPADLTDDIGSSGHCQAA